MTEKADVIFNARIDQSRKAIRVDAVTVRLVVFLVARVVYQERIQRGRATNDDTRHGVGLVVGTLLVTVLYKMEVTKEK